MPNTYYTYTCCGNKTSDVEGLCPYCHSAEECKAYFLELYPEYAPDYNWKKGLNCFKIIKVYLYGIKYSIISKWHARIYKIKCKFGYNPADDLPF